MTTVENQIQELAYTENNTGGETVVEDTEDRVAWIITRDHLEEQGSEYNRTGHRYGSTRGQSDPWTDERDKDNALAFRLYDDDGELYYEGLVTDDEFCEGQLACRDWGMYDAGCTRIEVKREGRWTQEID
jgi:hypothetical protein